MQLKVFHRIQIAIYETNEKGVESYSVNFHFFFLYSVALQGASNLTRHKFRTSAMLVGIWFGFKEEIKKKLKKWERQTVYQPPSLNPSTTLHSAFHSSLSLFYPDYLGKNWSGSLFIHSLHWHVLKPLPGVCISSFLWFAALQEGGKKTQSEFGKLFWTSVFYCSSDFWGLFLLFIFCTLELLRVMWKKERK